MDIDERIRTFDLDQLHASVAESHDGEVDRSVPEHADADSGLFGLAVCDRSGDVRQVGDTDVTFPIQSAVKPFVYALALVDAGATHLEEIGVEPTGEAFDAVRLQSDTGRPPNPMVNAGALLTASLVAGDGPQDRAGRILAGLSALAGRPLVVDEQVSRSEHLSGDRNRALGYLMHSAGTLHVDVEDAIEVYARVCAVSVSAETLAVMGATLAFGGRNPVTGDRVLPVEVVRSTLSVMATCGMYDGSGRWMHRVGMPAKSGVAGGVVAAAPRHLGIGVYSPPLNERGNSVRGVLACERLADDLGLHAFTVA
ncbi:glutaminase A [Aeromicrobium sp. Leaf245]|uniref:glutaminase A n=1 Tax=Aeromicrobium sp. Leaf245 TaxID=1736306 RepID=UPI0007022B85|nr:glutaminase A [Aeromicrobium sp. Leaf245]KQO39489.1 glutaminase A [Aeromicrobium sp. Leaf245]